MIGSSENRISYNGNGIATEFAYTFKILEKSNLKVLHVAADGTEELLTTDYYVDMEKSVVLYPGYAPGAEIPEQNRPPILPVGERLVIYREVPITQESALDKHWPFNVIENGLDKLTIICQQIWDRLQRSFYVSESTSTNFDPKVPIEAGKTFRVKDDGTGFEVTEDPGKVIDGATALLKQTTEQAVSANEAATNAQNAATHAETQADSVKKYKALWFDSVAAMKAEPSLTAGAYVNTAGYYAHNDGGGASYLIRTKTDGDTDDGGILHQLANGLVAELLDIKEKGYIDLRWFGADPTGQTGCSDILKQVIDYSNDNYITTIKVVGNFYIEKNIECIGSLCFEGVQYPNRYFTELGNGNRPSTELKHISAFMLEPGITAITLTGLGSGSAKVSCFYMKYVEVYGKGATNSTNKSANFVEISAWGAPARPSALIGCTIHNLDTFFTAIDSSGDTFIYNFDVYDNNCWYCRLFNVDSDNKSFGGLNIHDNVIEQGTAPILRGLFGECSIKNNLMESLAGNFNVYVQNGTFVFEGNYLEASTFEMNITGRDIDTSRLSIQNSRISETTNVTINITSIHILSLDDATMPFVKKVENSCVNDLAHNAVMKMQLSCLIGVNKFNKLPSKISSTQIVTGPESMKSIVRDSNIYAHNGSNIHFANGADDSTSVIANKNDYICIGFYKQDNSKISMALFDGNGAGLLMMGAKDTVSRGYYLFSGYVTLQTSSDKGHIRMINHQGTNEYISASDMTFFKTSTPENYTVGDVASCATNNFVY